VKLIVWRLAMTKLNKYWALSIILLIAVIITGGIVAWQRYSPPQPIEISLSPSPQFQGEIYLGGAVSNPGFYPLESDDSLEALVQAAGGTTEDADLTQLKLYIPMVGEEQQPQKIDLNRAEDWLLEALPGIGETLAQRIIDYRLTNGAFGNITEITKVEGIGPSTYEQIKDLITVAD
jgi:competence protein ComEA